MHQRDNDGTPQMPPTPYHNPQNFTPPPSPRPDKRKLSSRKGFWLAIGGIIAFVLIAALTNGGKTPPGQTAASTDTATTVATSAPQTAASTDPSPVTNASDALAVGAPPVTSVKLSLNGSESKKTKTFTVGDDWSIKYSFDCSNFGMQGNFVIDVYNADGSLADGAANALAMKGADTTYEHASSGTYYLDINSECTWKITVTDGDTGQ